MTIALIAKWALVAWAAIGALAVIGAVGKERKPITPRMAVQTVMILATEIVIILIWWH